MKILYKSLLVLMLAGCASNLTPAGQTVLARIAAMPVTCVDGPDCKEKWSRASDWISRNSAYGFRNHSKYLLQTSGPTVSGVRPAIRVTRYARSQDGVYVFTFSAWCKNGIMCSPDELTLKASFVSFVLGSKTVQDNLAIQAQNDSELQAIMRQHTPLQNQ